MKQREPSSDCDADFDFVPRTSIQYHPGQMTKPCRKRKITETDFDLNSAAHRPRKDFLRNLYENDSSQTENVSASTSSVSQTYPSSTPPSNVPTLIFDDDEDFPYLFDLSDNESSEYTSLESQDQSLKGMPDVGDVFLTRQAFIEACKTVMPIISVLYIDIC